MKSFFAKNVNKTLFAIILMLLSILAGCEISDTYGIDIPDKPFFASIQGTVDGIEIKADVYCDPTEHKTKEIYTKLTVSFISPESLAGITVSLHSDGKATVRLNSTEEELPLYSAIAEPFLSLCPGKDYSSIEKTAEGIEVIYENKSDKLTCLFGKNGRIQRITGSLKERKINIIVTNINENDK